MAENVSKEFKKAIEKLYWIDREAASEKNPDKTSADIAIRRAHEKLIESIDSGEFDSFVSAIDEATEALERFSKILEELSSEDSR